MIAKKVSDIDKIFSYLVKFKNPEKYDEFSNKIYEIIKFYKMGCISEKECSYSLNLLKQDIMSALIKEKLTI
jgi:hypothetical protein